MKRTPSKTRASNRAKLKPTAAKLRWGRLCPALLALLLVLMLHAPALGQDVTPGSDTPDTTADASDPSFADAPNTEADDAATASKPRPSPIHPSDVSRALNDRPTMPVGWLILGAGLALMLISAISLVKWWRTRHLKPHPLLVYNGIARDVGLAPRDRVLLYRIAVQARLATPLTLMLSPRTLRVHSRAYLDRTAPWRRGPLRARLVSIHHQLYRAP